MFYWQYSLEMIDWFEDLKIKKDKKKLWREKDRNKF